MHLVPFPVDEDILNFKNCPAIRAGPSVPGFASNFRLNLQLDDLLQHAR